MPSAQNVDADAVTRTGRVEHVRSRHEHFAGFWDFWGTFDVDHTATDVPAQRTSSGRPQEEHISPFFSRYACPGAAAIDVLLQDVFRNQNQTTGVLISVFHRYAQKGRCYSIWISARREWWPLCQQ